MNNTPNSNNYLSKESFVSSSKIITPCETTCCLDTNHSYCETCGRTSNQIQDWLTYDHDTKKQVVKEAKTRRKKLNGLGTSN